ncbi:MAG: hypothetical protein GWN31_08785 [Candidatus Thorarchaeota archaeon]|nr:hypothetical protein [Candidatus Thorarchaeota archaeon]NIW14012.1 hypothetical protein [Candidatus Thorarchaeota archaeon]
MSDTSYPTIKKGETVHFIYKDKIHSITPRVDIEHVSPYVLAMIADEDFMLKESARFRDGVQWKPFLDAEYGEDPEYLPVIISNEEAKELLNDSSPTTVTKEEE